MNAEQTGHVIDQALDDLREHGDAAHRAGEALVRALMEFYGAGLAQLVTVLGRPGAGARDVLDDDLVTGLLALHDLHPDDVTARVERALARVPAHPAEIADLDPGAATLRLRLTSAGGCGCASTPDAAREALTASIALLAPEIATVDVETAAPEPALLQIASHRPGTAGAPR